MLEAFTLGLPAVVNATPWRDNSQIEIVDHMVDGIVANTPCDYAEAIAFLNRDRARRLDMGSALLRRLECTTHTRLPDGSDDVLWIP